jgi:hypothetical protein
MRIHYSKCKHLSTICLHLVLDFVNKRRRRSKLTSLEKCNTIGCNNLKPIERRCIKRADGSTFYKYSTRSYCYKCKCRRMRELHHISYLLNNLRCSARRRNIPFTLTYADFEKFCHETGYDVKHGQLPDSLTVDRIDSNEGYHIWNIRALSFAENSAQGSVNGPKHRHDVLDADPF